MALIPGGPSAPVNTGSTFPDPFKVSKQKEEQLRRKREAARRLVEAAAPQATTIQGTNGPLGQLPDIRVQPSIWEHAASALQKGMAGYELAQLDKEGTQLDQQASEAAKAQWELERRMKEQDRDAGWAREDQQRADDAEASYNQRLRDAENKAIQDALDHEQAKELKAMPQLIESNSYRSTNVTSDRSAVGSKAGAASPTNGGTTGAGSSFAGVAQQVGIDPRNGNAVFRHKDSGRLFSFDEAGTATLHQGLVAPKPTSAQTTAQAENKMLTNQVDDAIAQTDANPDAFGWKTLAPSQIVDRLDKEGVATRAAVAALTSAQIKDTSGAAVSAAEQQRLNKFLPAEGDSPEAVRIKLGQYKAELDRKGYVLGNNATAPTQAPARKITRTGKTKDGRKVVQYDNGDVEYQ